ncbi:MAG: site-specific integrase [Acidobacteria bacterium]|nr:site-specific integrase [Acidobacteriota bacterium]
MASIVKRPNRPKPWFVFWREPGTKQQKARAFDTKKEAEAFHDQVRQDIRHGTYQPLKPIPFKEWAEGWLERHKAFVGPKTAAIYEWALQVHLIPQFGPTPIQSLRAEQIETWQARLLDRKPGTQANGKPAKALSRRSVQMLRTTLGAILKDARKKGHLYANPMEMVERFAVPKRDLRYLSVEQLKGLCEKVGSVYGVLFLTLGLCGLRMGEALGLQWSDLDLERGRLFVRRQVIWLRKKDCKAGEPRWGFAEPKSEAGKRVVELPPVLVPFLQAHRAQQNGAAGEHGLVFCTRYGTPLDGKNIRRRHFEPALKELGIAGIRLHDFRRTFIALHVEAGTHPKLVQARVGHSDIRLTMDTYGKLAGEMPLGAEQATRFNGLATKALPVLVNAGQHEASKQPKKALTSPKRGEA